MNPLSRILRSVMKITTAAALSLAAGTHSFAEPLESPPAPGPPRPLHFPSAVEKSLPNGLRVVVVQRQDGMPLVAASLLVRNGGEIDPPGLDGLANLTAGLLSKGTATRSAPQIAEAVDSLGAALGSDVRWDASSVSVNAMSAKFEPALEILADLVRNPAFREEEIDRLRSQLVDELTIELAEPRTIARYVAARVVFGDAPYGHGLQGTPETLQRIRREDITGVHQRFYQPGNALLVVVGQVEPPAAFAAAERLFGDWASPTPAPQQPDVPAAAPATSARVVVVDKPDAEQATVYLARTGIRRTDAEYFPAIVTNAVLGGGYSARLNQEVRIKRGLSYGAGSAIDARRHVGPFVAVAQTKNESAPEVARVFLAELRRLAQQPVPEDELRPRKASLNGRFARELETVDGLVEEVGHLLVYGLGVDWINGYVGNVEAVTPADVQKFAGERLAVAGASIVIVGNAKQFLEVLRLENPVVEVIPEEALDLGSAGLRKAAATGE